MLSVLFGASVGLLGLRAAAPWLPSAPLCEGIRLEGETVPRGSSLERFFDERETRARARQVRLVHGLDGFELTLAEAGLHVDRGRTAERVLAVGHKGPLASRLRAARLARRGGVDLPMTYAVDRATLALRLQALSTSFERAPVNAGIDLARHSRAPDVSGRALDVEATVDALIGSLDALASGVETQLDLVVVERRAAVTLADLQDIDVTKVLASFETSYSIHKVGRAGNVELAATKLDGLVVPPGGVISFNERVGPRTRAVGFHEAPEIVGDELTTGIGGGTCQVSSTLYGAALNGALEVVSRRSHSRPSDYTALGMDATVKYPEVDLRLRNPYSYAVIVHAFVVKPGKLRVELLGGEEVEKVHYRYTVSKVEPYLRRITEKAFLPPGKVMRKQKGTRGMDVHSTVVIRYRDGRSETRTFFSGYRATPEVFWVAPGFDRGQLPVLPEHAKGVEGEQSASDDVYAG